MHKIVISILLHIQILNIKHDYLCRKIQDSHHFTYEITWIVNKTTFLWEINSKW